MISPQPAGNGSPGLTRFECTAGAVTDLVTRFIGCCAMIYLRLEEIPAFFILYQIET